MQLEDSTPLAASHFYFIPLAEHIADFDRQQSDILHRIERPDCKCRERNRLATQLAAIRRDRRVLKDWLKVNQPYFEYIGSDDGERIQKMLGNLTGIGRQVEKNKASRTR